MKAFKILLTPYEYEIEEPTKEGREQKKKTMYVKWLLPRILCNSALGGTQSGPQVIPHPEFDLMQIGPVAQKLEQTTEPYCVLTSDELDILKKRIKTISKFMDYSHFEMFQRVANAQEITLVEKPKD